MATTEPCLCGATDCPRCFPSTRSRKLAQAISPESYADTGYSACPICQSQALSGGPVDIDGKYATQEMDCEDCGASWQDLYVLEAYINLDVAH